MGKKLPKKRWKKFLELKRSKISRKIETKKNYEESPKNIKLTESMIFLDFFKQYYGNVNKPN